MTADLDQRFHLVLTAIEQTNQTVQQLAVRMEQTDKTVQQLAVRMEQTDKPSNS